MTLSYAENRASAIADRVGRSTDLHLNEAIDRQTDDNIQRCAGAGPEAVRTSRRTRPRREWDIERALEVNASTLAQSGLALDVAVN